MATERVAQQEPMMFDAVRGAFNVSTGRAPSMPICDIWGPGRLLRVWPRAYGADHSAPGHGAECARERAQSQVRRRRGGHDGAVIRMRVDY